MSSDQSFLVAASAARDTAWDRLKNFLLRGEGGPPALASWSVENIPEGAANPFESGASYQIFDINGDPLLHDFGLPLKTGGQIRARMAADNRLANAAQQFMIAATYPIDQWIAAAISFAKSNGLVPEAAPQQLVCYCYPKLGLLCRDAAGNRCVVDLAQHTVVSILPFDQVLAKAKNGATQLAWSPLAAMKAQAAVRTAVATPAAAAATPVFLADMSNMQLFPQEQQPWCACATAQMILHYDGINCTQTQIAVQMQTSTDGTEPAQQLAAYAPLSNGALTATLEDPPVYSDGQTQINASHPFKSAIIGHARAVAGWKIDPADNSQWIYVYDPWPPKDPTTGQGGAVYWENWTALNAQQNYVNDIFVTPAH